MALMYCPDCGRKVSDKATACPDCGCPIAATQVKTVRVKIYREGFGAGTAMLYDATTKKQLWKGAIGQVASFDIEEPIDMYAVWDYMMTTKKSNIIQGVKGGDNFEFICAKKGIFGGFEFILQKVDAATSGLAGW